MRRVEVGTAAMVAAVMLGTVPAVGGYSNTTRDADNARASRPMAAASQIREGASSSDGGEFTTVGIVTEVTGAAFALSSSALEKGKSEAQTVESGQGVISGDRMWVEPHGLVRLTDTDGGKLSIAGPASVEFVRKSRVHAFVRILKGSVKFHAADGESMHFENPLVAGLVAGEGAVWASEETVQVLGLAGDVRAWHPQLEQAAVLVTPGYFSESSTAFRHLQPTRPVRVDDGHFETFLSRFEDGPIAVPAGPAPERNLASEPVSAPEDEGPVVRGTRTKAQLEAPRDDLAMKRLRAHISGTAIDEVEVEKPLVASAPKYNAYFSVKRGPHSGKDGQKLIKQIEESE